MPAPLPHQLPTRHADGCVPAASTATSPSTHAGNSHPVASTAANATALRASAATTAWNPVRKPPRPRHLSRGRHTHFHFTECGSLARGPDRSLRTGKSCECDEGWTGINCNVCTSDRVCNAMTETGDGGVCYTGGEVVKQNYQMCDVTNRAIRDLLGAQIPQVTFTCDKGSGDCDFQCTSSFEPRPSRCLSRLLTSRT